MSTTKAKAPLTLAVALTAILLLLHYPFDGYQTSITIGGDMSLGFYIPAITSEIPIAYWRSLGSIIPWLDTLKNFLVAVALIWITFGAWWWTKRK